MIQKLAHYKSIFFIFSSLLFLAACSTQTISQTASKISGTHPLVDNIPCETMEELSYHVHAHLNIFIDGKLQNVPAQIGIPNFQCVYWLHTHDLTGVIHIEAPSKTAFSLGEFFDIWHEPLSPIQVATYTTDATHTFKFFVNGQEYTGDPRIIPLDAHTTIDIELGPPFPTPKSFTFPFGE